MMKNVGNSLTQGAISPLVDTPCCEHGQHRMPFLKLEEQLTRLPEPQLFRRFFNNENKAIAR